GRSGRWARLSAPPHEMLPPDGSPSPAISRSAEDLPQPDGPSRETNSPARIVRSNPSSASVPPANRLTTPLRVTIGAAPRVWLVTAFSEAVNGTLRRVAKTAQKAAVDARRSPRLCPSGPAPPVQRPSDSVGKIALKLCPCGPSAQRFCPPYLRNSSPTLL